MRIIPTPADLLGAAAAVKDGVNGAVDGVSGAIDLVPRAATLITRIDGVVDRIERLLDRAEASLQRVDGTLAGADASVAAADQVIKRSELTVTKADRAVAGATGVMERADRVVGQIEPIARKGTPIAARLVDNLSATEIDAAISLVDRLPQVLTHLDEDVLPMLQQLDQVGPDVHQILEVVEDLRAALDGVPGMGLLKRLGDRKDDDEAQAERRDRAQRH